MHKILVIRLYFNIRSTCFGLYQSIFRSNLFISSMSYLVCAGVCRYHTSDCCVAIATQQPDVWYRLIPAHTKCDVQLIKIAPEDGVIQFETSRAYIEIRSNHKKFVHLVGLYAYFRMMHGA
jgi:hypothetical protein